MILRRKLRYILIESSEDMDIGTASSLALNGLMRFLGEEQYANANPRLIRQYGSRMYALRVNRGTERRAVLGLAFVRSAADSAGLYTIKTSGSMHSISEYASKELHRHSNLERGQKGPLDKG